MTKLEALAKDCIENHTHRLVDKPTKQDIYLREESIFIQGYRQSEKRIAELEKSCDETQELLDKQIEATYKLYKENAELKEQQFSLRNERNTFLAQNEQYEKDLIDFNENLTEAKEIMQKLVANAPDTYSGTNIELQQKKMFSFQDAVNKAEYFLNSEVKE